MQDSLGRSIFGLSHVAGLLLFAAGAGSYYRHLPRPSGRAPAVSQAGAAFGARTGNLEGNPQFSSVLQRPRSRRRTCGPLNQQASFWIILFF